MRPPRRTGAGQGDRDSGGQSGPCPSLTGLCWAEGPDRQQGQEAARSSVCASRRGPSGMSPACSPDHSPGQSPPPGPPAPPSQSTRHSQAGPAGPQTASASPAPPPPRYRHGLRRALPLSAAGAPSAPPPKHRWSAWLRAREVGASVAAGGTSVSEAPATSSRVLLMTGTPTRRLVRELRGASGARGLP